MRRAAAGTIHQATDPNGTRYEVLTDPAGNLVAIRPPAVSPHTKANASD